MKPWVALGDITLKIIYIFRRDFHSFGKKYEQTQKIVEAVVVIKQFLYVDSIYVSTPSKSAITDFWILIIEFYEWLGYVAIALWAMPKNSQSYQNDTSFFIEPLSHTNGLFQFPFSMSDIWNVSHWNCNLVCFIN